jgi:hypothetical protein
MFHNHRFDSIVDEIRRKPPLYVLPLSQKETDGKF